MSGFYYDADELVDKADQIHALALEHTFFPDGSGGDGQEQAFRIQCALSHARGADECLGGSGGSGGADARAEISAYYRSLTDEITTRTRPYPSHILDRVGDLEAVVQALGFPGYESLPSNDDRDADRERETETPWVADPAVWQPFTEIESALDQWSGNFKDRLAVYFESLRIVHDNIAKALGVLASATYAIRDLNHAKRKTLASIIDNTVEALGETGHSGQGLGDDGIDFTHGLWVAGAALPLLALGLPASAATGLTLSGSAISATEHFYRQPDGGGNALGSNTAMPAHVLAKMAGAIADNHDEYVEGSRLIADHLRKQNDDVQVESRRALATGDMANCFVLAEPVAQLRADGDIYANLIPT